MRHLLAGAAILGLLLCPPAKAQSIGGNANLPVTTGSAQVALPAPNSLTYPSLLIVPAPGSAETFYQFGTSSSVTASITTSPAVPSGGVCINNTGPATNLAAITASGTATLRLTQVPTCVPFSSIGGAVTGTVNILTFGNYVTDSITQVAGVTFTLNTAWNNTATQKFFTLAGACRVNGGEVLIPQIDIWSTVNPTLKLTGILWLFAGVPSANIANNATFTLASADYAITLSKQGFPFTLGNTQATGASNSGATISGVTYAGRCPTGSTTISGMVEVTNAYVSATGEVLNVGFTPVGVN